MYGLFGSSGGWPAEKTAAWLFAWSSDPLLVILVLLLLLFPNGRFLSRRWRLVGVAAVAIAMAWAAAIAFDPGPLYNFETVSNPLGIDAAGGVLEAIAGVGSVVLPLLLIAAAASVVVRYRQARSTERQQIKWLAAAAALGAVMVLGLTTLTVAMDTDHGAGEVITSILAFLAVGTFPLAAGIAMLRYRLYDIDVVINRALVYGALTAILAGIYVGSVLLLQLVLRPLTEESNLAIAASTLAVAGLFRPARSRIQAAVDRRFYRRKYDAARTLERFGCAAARRGRPGRARQRAARGRGGHHAARARVAVAAGAGVAMSERIEPEWEMVTVMFVDIRGFTTFAHHSTAQEAVAYLNEFFAVVVPILTAHGGHANKLLGDGLLGVFGAPDRCPDHADRALAAAAEMLASVESNFGERCRIGIGINSGLVLVGTIGGGELVEFGVIGDPVNVAARVQDATRELDEPLLLTEATRCLLEREDVGLEPRGTLALKGRAQPVAVHALESRNAFRTPSV